jgi:hypothetical protein
VVGSQKPEKPTAKTSNCKTNYVDEMPSCSLALGEEAQVHAPITTGGLSAALAAAYLLMCPMAPAVTVEYERDCSISENGTAKTKGALAGARLVSIISDSLGVSANLPEIYIPNRMKNLAHPVYWLCT